MSRKLFFNCLFVFAGLVAGICASVHPWQVWMEQRQRADEKLAQMRSAERVREELLRKQSRAKTNLGREELARANGWIRPGETPSG